MIQFLILTAIIIFVCVFLNNASFRIGVPVLLAFILFGMLFGNNGIFQINFQDYDFAEQLCTVALVFIMFYGGFGTNWHTAKTIATESGILATVGVFLTALITALFCHLALRWDWVEAFLMGSVISSTDAASVFSILRANKLGLKNNTAPILEMESGSNDPCSYMMTLVMLTIMTSDITAGKVVWILVSQLGFGALCGVGIALGARFLVSRIKFATSGFDSLFMIATALFAYSVPSLIGGNGYLSVYIVGIVLGNSQFRGKKELSHFFDGVTGLMQVLIFFMLGLLARPAMLGKCLLISLAIFFFLLFIARPATIALVMTPFRKYNFKQQVLLSFCGLRGAASIVFAIFATIGNNAMHHDIFSVVFCIVLLSIGLQGTLIPYVAKKLDMIDSNADVMKTFTDFEDTIDLQFTEMKLTEESPWVGKIVKDLGIPKDILFCLVTRKDGSKVVPNGYTLLQTDDVITMCSKQAQSAATIRILEHRLPKNSKWNGKEVREYPIKKSQLLLITRGAESIIPHGGTVLQSGDVLYINKAI